MPPLADAALAAALGAANVAQILLTPDVDRPVWLLLALGVLTTAPLAWRRTAPLPAALVFSVFLFVLLAGDYPEFLLGTLAASVIFPYSVGTHVDSLWISAIPVAIIVTAGWVDDVRLDHPAGQYLATVMTLFVPWALARVVKRLREQTARLEHLTARLEAQRDQSARAAVIEERNRIARELHDLVAHAISVIAVQSAGAESALGRNPADARRPLKLIQRTSREALLEMRRMLQVLRGSPGGSGDPQPGIEDIPRLIEQAEAAGTDVSFEVNGNGHLARTLDLNAYRIVQECLTNVRKHAGAGAKATVTVDREPTRLRIVVRDDGPGMRDDGDPGHGLLGIRERARLFGGKMTAGDSGGGGFTVEVEIPVSSEPIAPEETP